MSCIGLRVLETSKGFWVFLFRQSILADLLGNTRLLERVQKVTVCDLWILIGFVCFCVSRFVAGDRPVSGNNRLVLFEDSVSYDLS